MSRVNSAELQPLAEPGGRNRSVQAVELGTPTTCPFSERNRTRPSTRPFHIQRHDVAKPALQGRPHARRFASAQSTFSSAVAQNRRARRAKRSTISKNST